MIGLCDCNNFFASCERVFRPDLEGKPIVVLSNNDGCVVARSNESKSLGIKMGVPLFQIEELVKRENVNVFSSNYQLYCDMSNRVMSTLRQYVPVVEVYSIDEAFLDFSLFQLDDLEQYGRSLSKIIRRNTGIPVSIGIAPTKTLAKIASKLCKKYPKLEGCCLMYRGGDIDKVLHKFPIEDVWGIGRRFGALLRKKNILTAADFLSLPSNWIKGEMGVVGQRIWMELKGEPAYQIEFSPQDKETICVSRSFSQEITSFDELRSAISSFASIAAAKLRRQYGLTSQIRVFIQTNPFKKEMSQQFESAIHIFEVATDSTIEIASKAIVLLNSIFRSGYAYKRGGIILSQISSSNQMQGVIFDSIDHEKHSKLMKTIDEINRLNKCGAISLASSNDMNFFSNRNHVSPSYTTKLEDIIVVK